MDISRDHDHLAERRKSQHVGDNEAGTNDPHSTTMDSTNQY